MPWLPNRTTGYTYTPVYIKQEKWDDIKNDFKSFKELLKIFEVKENKEA